jgi:drug/metabolite transporter (DMT)-like permease
MLMRIAPVVFVLLWSTGFIGSKLGADDAEPFTFLALRFLIVLALLAPVLVVSGRRARGWNERGHAVVVGMLIHGAYLGGVFWAIRLGMPAGVAALIVSLQPVLTSLLSAPLLGEKLSARHWTGLALGLAGAVLILEPGLASAMEG